MSSKMAIIGCSRLCVLKLIYMFQVVLDGLAEWVVCDQNRVEMVIVLNKRID